jgi:hypothetical protein
VIIIPGFLIAIATFPGVIVHEAAHLLFCRLYGLPVLQVCFFRFGTPAGFVIHGKPSTFRAAFFTAMGPFFLNTALCVLFCLPAVIPVWDLETNDPLSLFFAWLGISIGAHAFPSREDLSNLWALAPTAWRERNLLALASYPLIVALYLAGFLRFFWIDFIYGVAVGILLPLAIFRWLV